MSEIKLGRYKHYKGNDYEVLHIAKHSETQEDMVVYRALYGENIVWVRPKSMWNEIVEFNGKKTKRFTYMGNISIAKESILDRENIFDFIKTAFQTAEVSDENEQYVVENIRNSSAYISKLTLVAKDDDEIVGFLMISKTDITVGGKKYKALNLGPIAVKQDRRNQKIGTMLMQEGIKKAKELGYKSIFLAGNPKFYSRFGFVPALNYGIKCNVDVPEDKLPNIMALELVEGALSGMQNGIVRLAWKYIFYYKGYIIYNDNFFIVIYCLRNLTSKSKLHNKKKHNVYQKLLHVAFFHGYLSFICVGLAITYVVSIKRLYGLFYFSTISIFRIWNKIK